LALLDLEHGREESEEAEEVDEGDRWHFQESMILDLGHGHKWRIKNWLSLFWSDIKGTNALIS